MSFEKELKFLREVMESAYQSCAGIDYRVTQKTQFDLVTDIDLAMERYISEQIRISFPEDKILGEEFTSNTALSGRVWTIDPVDGTCNMAGGLKLYGVQCSLIIDAVPVVSTVYLPHFNEWIYASLGGGCFCNGERVSASSEVSLNNAIVSFGDYPHRAGGKTGEHQHKAIGELFPKIAKIRMFGAACIDFASVAQGRTHGTVVITKNVWDVAPGVLLCREAGAIVTDLKGNDYTFFCGGVVVASNKELSDLICKSFRHELSVGDVSAEGLIFDFDGVIMDTEKFHYQGWKKAFESLGTSLDKEEYEPLKSTGRGNIFSFAAAKLGRALGEEEMAEAGKLKDQCFAQLLEGADENDFIPGALDLVALLSERSYRVAVASSSKNTGELIKRFGLEGYFDAVLDGNEAYPKKPSPEIFLACADKLKVMPEKCLVFEDSRAGIEGAVNAGMKVIAVGREDDRASLSVKDLTEIIKITE